jgi:tryptophan-rich sensory protein
VVIVFTTNYKEMNAIKQHEPSREPVVFMSPLVHNRLSRIEEELHGISTRLTKVESYPLSCMSPRRLAKLLFENFKHANNNTKQIKNTDASTQTPTILSFNRLSGIYTQWWNELNKRWSPVGIRIDPLWTMILRASSRRFALKYERDIVKKKRLPRAYYHIKPRGLISDSLWLPLDSAKIPSNSSGYISIWKCNHRASYRFDNKGSVVGQWSHVLP